MPYDKNVPRISALLLNLIRAASAGYAVVVQDVRGRFASDGEFYTFRHEPDDGYDTIAWAAAQPWRLLSRWSRRRTTMKAGLIKAAPSNSALTPVGRSAISPLPRSYAV